MKYAFSLSFAKQIRSSGYFICFYNKDIEQNRIICIEFHTFIIFFIVINISVQHLQVNRTVKRAKSTQTKHMYYNYHAKAKRLIEDGHLIDAKVMEKWNSISPALVLFYDNAPPMPIRKHRWEEYFALFENMEITISI